MKLVLGSDLHGYLPDVPPCDILILAGDILSGNDQKRFYQILLKQWLEKVPARHVVATWGNHDWPFNVQGLPGLKWHMLIDEGICIEGLKFYGLPWTIPFYQWAWQAPEPSLDKLCSFIPDDTDILISHGPPFGICDKNIEGFHSGSKSLYDRMIELPRLKLLVCGHIHEARGQSGIVVNASCTTRHLQLITNPWIVLEL